VAAASVIGSIIEWYDLFVYGSLVVVLSGIFFPTQDPSVSVLYALGAFVAGAAVRPLGGAVFGRIGDRTGRKGAFLLTVVVMGAGAFLTGLLPTYAAIGIAAPLLLVTLRIIEGLAMGGEFGGATVYLAEDRRRRGPKCGGSAHPRRRYAAEYPEARTEPFQRRLDLVGTGVWNSGPPALVGGRAPHTGYHGPRNIL
jgi:MFS family permease